MTLCCALYKRYVKEMAVHDENIDLGVFERVYPRAKLCCTRANKHLKIHFKRNWSNDEQLVLLGKSHFRFTLSSGF